MNNLTTLGSRGGTGRRNGLKILNSISTKWQNIRFLRVSVLELPEIDALVKHSFRHIPVTSVNQRFFKMIGIVRNMAVNFGKHASIRMSHDTGNRKVIMALNQLPSGETMASRITEQSLAKNLGYPVESIADGKFSPCLTSGVSEQFTIRSESRKALNNFQCLTLKVNNALSSLSFGFLRWKYYAFILNLNMPGFDMSSLLRTRTSLPYKFEQIEERVITLNQCKDILVIFRRHIYFPALRLRLLELFNRIGFYIAQFFTPIIYAFDGNHRASTIGITPSLAMRINPLHYLIGLETGSRSIGYARIGHKLFEIASIPFMGAWRLMRLAPSKKFGGKRIECDVVFHTLIISNNGRVWKC